jgi:hypothetical protein
MDRTPSLPNDRPARTTGTPRLCRSSGLLPVHTDQYDTVHISASQITKCYLVIARRVRHEQTSFNSARRKLPAHAPEHEREEWLGKTRELSTHTTNAIGLFRRGADERGAGSARRPVPHIAEARDHLFDLAAGLRPYPSGAGEHTRRGPGETSACSATSASVGRNFVSVPGTPASLPAIFGPGRLAAGQFPRWRTACQRRAPERFSSVLRSCNSLLDIPVIPTALARGFGEPAAGLRCYSHGPRVPGHRACESFRSGNGTFGSANHLMKLSWDITTVRGPDQPPTSTAHRRPGREGTPPIPGRRLTAGNTGR